MMVIPSTSVVPVVCVFVYSRSYTHVMKLLFLTPNTRVVKNKEKPPSFYFFTAPLIRGDLSVNIFFSTYAYAQYRGEPGKPLVEY